MKLLLASLVLTTTLLNSGCLAEKRVLALLENLAVKETHSAFFRLLTDQGFTLTFKAGFLGIRHIFVMIRLRIRLLSTLILRMQQNPNTFFHIFFL
jgi:hypothetical protein